MQRSTPSTRFLVALAGGVLLAACPVGCPKANPQTIYVAPEEKLAVEKTGRCTFKVLGRTEGRPFPVSDDGFYRVELDGFTATLDWQRFDAATRILTVRDQWCHDGLALTLYYQPFARTAFSP